MEKIHFKDEFVHLGRLMMTLSKEPNQRNANEQSSFLADMDDLIRLEVRRNGWFTEENVRLALKGIGQTLTAEQLETWLQKYPEPVSPKKVGLVLAGNLPLVGFHDVLCTLLAGHTALVKMSRDDNRLLPALLSAVPAIDRVQFVDRLTEFDAVIATGSGNTSRYFEYYFAHVPHIIRRNRTSVAVLTGEESDEELKQLADDVFQFFGLGCRNVTKVFMPHDFDLNRMFAGFFHYKDIVNHNKYANNYDYHKALWLLNREDLIENGFLIVKEEEQQLVSPVGTLFTKRYNDINAVKQELEDRSEELQCVVGRGYTPFGQAQQPCLWDYADGVDTLDWLLKL
jgi:hypothetical protein